MNIYPIGTVISLKKDKQELMITSRFPLYNKDGELGYFDYGACLFPQGILNDSNYFFNAEDIEEVHFTGYLSETEKELQKNILKELNNIKYPKFFIRDK